MNKSICVTITAIAILLAPLVAAAIQEQQTAEQINVTVKGGIGAKVIVENTGDETIEDITWEINIEKAGKIAFVLFGTKKGRIESLAPGEAVKVPSLAARLLPPTIGFGKVNITVTVDGVTKKAKGILVGIFLLGVKEI